VGTVCATECIRVSHGSHGKTAKNRCPSISCLFAEGSVLEMNNYTLFDHILTKIFNRVFKLLKDQNKQLSL
jgi:hypothetical protein